jgi:putative transposase
MRKLGLKCIQCQSYKSTTNSKPNNRILSNVLDQCFNSEGRNQAWSPYLPTRRDWVYLVIVMDLHSRKIVGWSMAERMSTALIM